MNIYTVTFFGHRFIDNIFKIEEKLEPILKVIGNLVSNPPAREYEILIYLNCPFA